MGPEHWKKRLCFTGTFYSLLGKRNMTQCQERKFFLQIKRVNICLLLIVKTHLMVLLYFVFLRSSNYFKKMDFLKSDLLEVFLKQDWFFSQKNWVVGRVKMVRSCWGRQEKIAEIRILSLGTCWTFSLWEPERGWQLLKIDQLGHLNLLIGLNVLDGNLLLNSHKNHILIWKVMVWYCEGLGKI